MPHAVPHWFLVLTLALASVLAVRLGRELTAVEDGRVPALNN